MKKREARFLFLEGVPEAGMVLVLVFRGGWIDAIASAKVGSFGELKGWLESSGYLDEARFFDTGDGLKGILGDGLSSVEAWLSSLGIGKATLPIRNAEQARVIICGIRQYFAMKR